MNRGIVAAGHERTAQAAWDILEAGGNAFDAAVAAGFAASAAEPVLTSLGGGGFLLARNNSGAETLYDFFVQTPRQFPPLSQLEFFPIHADFGPTTQEFHIGCGSVAVPGTIAGLFAVHRDLGKLPIEEVILPAVRLCREGTVVDAFQEYLFQVVRPIYAATEEARQVYGSPSSPGQLVLEGDRIRFPELADTIEALAKEGPDLFYRGELAKKLAEQCRQGGALTIEDLKNYRVERRKPLEFFYRGNRILLNPPPSWGGILIAFTLQLLERAETPAGEPDQADDLIPLARAMEQTNQARLEGMEGCAKALRGTTHLNVIDAQGNIASLSLSNGEGCGHILKGTGIMLNNMLGEEDLLPQGLEKLPKDQRMSSMMAPTLLFQKNGTILSLGSGGSNRIRTAIVQVLRHLVDHQMSVSEAVNFPRIHFERGLLSVEAGFPDSTLERLKENFSELHLWEERNLFFGGVHALSYHPSQGFAGAGDPRRDGVCI